MRITHIIGCMAWAALFLGAMALIPVAGLFIGLLTPLPFTYYLVGLPTRQALQAVCIVVGALFLLSLVAGIERLGLFCVQFGLLGFTLAWAFQHRLGIGWTVGLGTAALLGVSAFMLIIVAFAHNTGPVEMIRAYLAANLNLPPKAYESMGLPPEKAVEIKAYMEMVRNAVLRIYPALMVIGSAFVAWVNIMLAMRLFRSRGLSVFSRKEILMWKAPEHLVWGLILSGFSLFLPFGGIRFVALNLLIILMTAYLFQGMSIIAYFLNRFKAPPWVRIVLYFLIAVQQVFLVLVALAGLFDQWINFRRAEINEV